MALNTELSQTKLISVESQNNVSTKEKIKAHKTIQKKNKQISCFGQQREIFHLNSSMLLGSRIL